MRAWIVVLLLSASAALCAGAAELGDPALAPLRGGPGLTGFAVADKPREFEFPRDHGPHPEFRTEWWYVTGNVESEKGERFGFELTFFRVALKPGTQRAPSGESSAWRTNQVYLAHFAVTDVAGGKFSFAQKYERGAAGLAGAQAAPLRVWLDDWSFEQQGDVWKLRARQPGYALEFEAKPEGAPVLNGDHGLSVKSGEPGAASYYYSIPRMSISGTMTRTGTGKGARGAVSVKGSAWLDREWSSSSLGATQAGWDWFALQMKDGSALMFYSLRDLDGTRDAHSAGTWIAPSGESHPLSSQDVVIDITDHWTSRRRVRYPSGWHLRVPSQSLDVEVKPVLADQELGTSPRYWEGAVDVKVSSEGQSAAGASRSAAGEGYVELVGYQ
ncbi:MAG TPA: lipocalin-like domain-containing protein [Steroidobacteraceae bacterium]|jgi:predicted secreted hydrolase